MTKNAPLPTVWCNCCSTVVPAGAKYAVERVSPTLLRYHVRNGFGTCHNQPIKPKDQGIHAQQAELAI